MTTRFTPEELHARGYRPDGRGGWTRDFDSGVAIHPLPMPIIEALAKAGLGSHSPSIRVPKRSGPNVTEQRWKDDHWHDWPTDATWKYEELSFRLPSGTLFTPDWCIFTGHKFPASLLAVVEVKGKKELASQRRAAHAFKEAVVAWPMLRWIWAKWDGATWIETEVPPV